MSVRLFLLFTVGYACLGYAACATTDLLYPWGVSEGDNTTCSGTTGGYIPDNPFKFTTQRGLPFFGVNYQDIYINPNGFVSDIAADGLSPGGKRKRFPLAAANSTWENCNTTADPNCWLTFYYDFSVWNSLVSAQNDSDVCVNGKSIAANFDYDEAAVWGNGAQGGYPPVVNPAYCVKASHPPVNNPNWMIAVYWAEMEVVADPAKLVFRETIDPTILAMAKADVESLANVTTFNPQWAFVITWYFMTYPQGYTYPVLPENNVQVVLVTDGTQTYGIYNYNQTQLGGGTVGFDSGDGTNYCSFSGSRTQSIRYVASKSNIGKPGRWVIPFSSAFDKTLCEPLRTESVSCECEEGWEGRLCATSINDCTENSCPSYALCIDGHINYTCDYCHSITCQNNGQCMNQTNSNSFFCNCAGYNSGEYCQMCGNLECQNGATCAFNTEFQVHYCQCADGFSGLYCETSDPILSTGAIVGIAVAVAVVLAGLTALIIYLIWRKKKKDDAVEPFDPDKPTDKP